MPRLALPACKVLLRLLNVDIPAGGARNDDLDDATAVHGLATTAGTNSDTGIGGLGTGKNHSRIQPA